MKKIDPSYNEEKQSLAKRRAQERLSSVQKYHLIEKSTKKPNSTHTQHLLRLRNSTLRNTLHSLENEQPATFHWEKTGPLSNDPNLAALRHNPNQKRRILLQSENGALHNINPRVLKVTPVKQSSHPAIFISPGETQYIQANTSIQLNNELSLIPLQELSSNKPSGPVRLQKELFPEEYAQLLQISSVKLHYGHFARPAGSHKPINNKKSHAGYSANDLAQIQLDDFEKGLIELGLATKSEMQVYSKTFNTVHYEHTHKFASHFGVLKDLEKQTIDPRDRLSTFVAPAALNTQMMLFEKFVDFLLFINHHRNGYQYRQPSVEYTCELITVPNTTQALALRLQITDFHTGKTFTQTWEKPYEVTQKPATAMYTTLLLLIKASLEGKALLGAPVEQNENRLKT